MSFLDVNIIREEGTYTTYVYRKATFSGSYAHFDSLLPSNYQIGMTHTLLHGCAQIFSNGVSLKIDSVNECFQEQRLS